MRKLASILLLLASCAEPEKRDLSREAFEDWARACVAGDAPKVWDLLSDANKSEWVFDRLQEGDRPALDWRSELKGQPRTELDLWLGVSKRRGNGRDETLPASALRHSSLLQLWKEYFARSADGIRMQISRLEINNVYGDDSGVTVAVKNGVGATELYGMVFERTGWKIDSHRQPLRPGGTK